MHSKEMDVAPALESGSFTFHNNLPPADESEKASSPVTASRSPFKWPDTRIARHTLISHIASLVLAVPTIALFAIDLHAYLSRDLSKPQPVTQATQYRSTNPIVILDGVAITLLAIEIIYSAIYLFSLNQSIQLITPTTIQQHIIAICCMDALLCVGVQAVSDTTISMRSGSSNCQSLLFLDAGACSSYRRTITRAAGAIGIVTSLAIHIRWSDAIRVWWSRSRRSNNNTGS